MRSPLATLVATVALLAGCGEKTGPRSPGKASVPAAPRVETQPVSVSVPENAVPEDRELRWSGCSVTRTGLMDAIAYEYRTRRGGRLSLGSAPETLAIRDVHVERVDVAGACRDRMPHEARAGLKFHPVAWDALAVVVHPDNPVDAISVAQLRRVLVGETRDWRDLGGEARPIDLLLRRSRADGVARMTRILVFRDPGKRLRPVRRLYEGTEDLEQALERNLLGIAVTGAASARKRRLKILYLNGIQPGVFEVRRGDYQLVRPLFLVTRGDASQQVAAFVNFAQIEAQRILAVEGSVTLRDGRGLWQPYRAVLRDAYAREQR